MIDEAHISGSVTTYPSGEFAGSFVHRLRISHGLATATVGIDVTGPRAAPAPLVGGTASA